MREKKNPKKKIEEIINGIPDAIIEFDSDWNFVYLSHLSLDLFGFHSNELVGLNLLKFIHPEDLLKIQSDMKFAVFSRTIINVEFRLRKKNMVYLPVSMKAVCKKFKDKDRIFAVIRDITNQKIAEKKLIESEEKFHILFELLPFGIILLNFKGVILEYNYKTLELFEYSKDEFIGKSYLELQAFPMKTRVILKKKFGEIKKGQKIEPFEIQIYSKNGKSIWLNVIASLVRLQDQIIIQVLIQDITKYKGINTFEISSY